MQYCDLHNFFLSGTVEDGNVTDIFPARNTTIPCTISSQYLYTIIAIFSVVFILLFVIITMKIVQGVRNCMRPSPYRQYRSGYNAVAPNNGLSNSNRFPDELNPITDVLIDASGIEYLSEPDTTSEYDNVSLDLQREEHNAIDDTPPPIYEYPPSYKSSGLQ
ncbi:hypothetical protein TNIN_194941 [Trichonephila inaurata madagascariensis]|uniref:Uncharacterized protein n=1 Tax=Trichonephila inaurata madagascariensis TaxID=2747483 RepID=A0A8X6XQ15_9ARAC|nr:hypothetical protein TNIN_194941 [Trichonephila inaurata madagascariensis]